MQVKTLDFNKYINITAIFFAFTIPISRAGIVLFTFLMILFWILEGDFKNKFKILKDNYLLQILFIFIVYYFISILWSSDIYEAFRYVIKFWYFIPIFIIVSSVKSKYIAYMISAFLFSMLISEIISYGIYFEIWNFKNVPSNDPTPFMNHLQYSMFLAFTALLLLNRFFIEKNYYFKYGYFLYFLTVTVNLFINGGRTGQVAFIVSIFVVGFLNVKNKIKAIFIISTLIVGILAIAYNYSANFKPRVDAMKHNIIEVYNNHNFNTSVGARIGFYVVGYEVIKDNPIIGVGVSDTMDNIKIYANTLPYDFTVVKSLPNVHNDFLQIFIQLGIIGAIVYILIFYNIFKIKIINNNYKNLPIIFVSVYMVSSLFENMIHQQFSMLLFTLFVGIFLNIKHNETKNII